MTTISSKNIRAAKVADKADKLLSLPEKESPTRTKL